MKLEFKINTIEEEQARIDGALAELEFYKSIGKKPMLPKTTLENEYNPEKYNKALKEASDHNFEDFIERLKLFFGTEKDITVNFTAYGSGGSYNWNTKNVLINIYMEDVTKTIKHEIIHLYIHDFEQAMEYSHQEKEDLVKQLEKIL